MLGLLYVRRELYYYYYNRVSSLIHIGGPVPAPPPRHFQVLPGKISLPLPFTHALKNGGATIFPHLGRYY